MALNFFRQIFRVVKSYLLYCQIVKFGRIGPVLGDLNLRGKSLGFNVDVVVIQGSDTPFTVVSDRSRKANDVRDVLEKENAADRWSFLTRLLYIDKIMS